MDRFEHGNGRPDVGGTGKTNGSGNLGGNIRDDVTVEIQCNDDVKRLRHGCHACGPDINDLVIALNRWILLGNVVEHLVEETVRVLHDVVFRHARNGSTTMSQSVFKGVSDNALATRTCYKLQNLGYFGSLLVLNPGIQVFLVFTNDDHIHTRMGRTDIRGI